MTRPMADRGSSGLGMSLAMVVEVCGQQRVNDDENDDEVGLTSE